MRKLTIQVRAIADAYDRKDAEVRGQQMEEYMQALKAKRANRPRDPDAFDYNALPPGEEGEKLRAWYGALLKEGPQEPKVGTKDRPAKQQPTKRRANRN